MKFIKDKNIVILEDDEEIIVQTLKGNPISISVKEKDGVLLVDEVSSKRIKEIALEEEQLKILKKQHKKD